MSMVISLGIATETARGNKVGHNYQLELGGALQASAINL